jgi:hypothetical protein
MEERRKAGRKRPTNYIAVINRETNEPIGCLVDLTIEGMRIINNEPIVEGNLLKLRIKLDEIEYILLDAQSRWCRKCEAADIYEIGFQTHNISADNLEKVRRLMESAMFTESLKATSVEFN